MLPDGVIHSSPKPIDYANRLDGGRQARQAVGSPMGRWMVHPPYRRRKALHARGGPPLDRLSGRSAACPLPRGRGRSVSAEVSIPVWLRWETAE